MDPVSGPGWSRTSDWIPTDEGTGPEGSLAASAEADPDALTAEDAELAAEAANLRAAGLDSTLAPMLLSRARDERVRARQELHRVLDRLREAQRDQRACSGATDTAGDISSGCQTAGAVLQVAGGPVMGALGQMASAVGYLFDIVGGIFTIGEGDAARRVGRSEAESTELEGRLGEAERAGEAAKAGGEAALEAEASARRQVVAVQDSTTVAQQRILDGLRLGR